MKDLREVLTSSGFQQVQTYIQSGNIVLESDQSGQTVEEIITLKIKETFGYDVPSLAYSMEEWKDILENCPYQEGEKKVYFTFLDQVPVTTDIEVKKAETDEFTIINNMVYLSCMSYGKTKLSNNLFENKLKVTATSRNFRTVNKLLELAQ